MVQVVRVRIQPSGEQARLLRGYMGTARAVYNILLWQVKAKYDQRKAEESYGFTGDDLTVVPWKWGQLNQWLKANRDLVLPWWREVPYRVMDNAVKQLATAFKRFFDKKAKFPVFKKKARSADAGLVPVSFSEKEVAWLGDGGRDVFLPMSKAVRKEQGTARAAELSRVRVLKDNAARRAAKLVHSGRGQVQEVTYSHTGGYWWASIRLRVVPKAQTRATRRPDLRQAGEVLGIDAAFGTGFVALSQPVEGVSDADGKVRAPQFLMQALKQLAKAQQAFALTTPGSKRHGKALGRVQRLHGKVAARRAQWHQSLAIELTERFELIGVETLNLKGMARRGKGRGYRFGRSVGEQGHSMFKDILAAQAGKRGSVVIPMDRFYPSSKTCSGCGAVKAKLPLSERVYHCSECGLVIDRDVNAARNIAAKARQVVPAKQVRPARDGVSDAGEASTGKTRTVDGLVREDSTASGAASKRRVPETDPHALVA